MKSTCIIVLLLQFSVLARGAISTTNPWKGVSLFINPDFTTSVSQAVATYPSDANLLSAAATYPVAYWVDSIGKIPNVSRILSFAKATQVSLQKKVLVEFIIYDLPNRDCAAYASNGEIPCEDLACANGIARYKAEYIDPLVAIMRQFPEVTIVLLIEPDSLPNLSTNLNTLRCPTASTAYVQGTAYAIQQLATLPNAAIYIDAAHGGWLGWPNNMASAVTTFKNVLTLAGGPQLIRGFATNTANYQALGSMSSTFDPCNLVGQYNMAIDEVHYVDLLDKALTAVGITGKSYIIDTSRNGIPTTRTACANWCNIRGSGLGVRPTADTAFTGSTLIDAVHWAKVPGESDGISDPNAPRYDRMCSSADSVAGAPQAGQWFASYFLELCKNAQPALVPAAPSGNFVGYTPGPPFIPRGTQVGATYDDVDATQPLSVGAKVGAAVGVVLFVAGNLLFG